MAGCLLVGTLTLGGCASSSPTPPASPLGRPSLSGASELPDVAELTCDGQGTKIETPVIQPQPDGVHVRITNTTDENLGLTWSQGGANANPGTHEVVLQLPPGRTEMGCGTGEQAALEELDVKDPEALWVPDEPDCQNGAVTGNADPVQGAHGDKGDPVDLVREMSQVRPTDTVERAGYPESENPVVRVVRDGKVVLIAHFFPDGYGGWLRNSYTACS